LLRRAIEQSTTEIQFPMLNLQASNTMALRHEFQSRQTDSL
jgi:hypothetical protein